MELGGDYLATGHYCQNQKINDDYCLVKGVDPDKDQTYFLYTITSQILSRVLFPIGGMKKSRVREIARENGLSTSNKKDSTGICFIGERNFKEFLGQYIKFEQGNFENTNGEVLGVHDGIPFYTIGQRKGLGIGGPGEPWFVVGKDPSRNVVVIEQGADHPALFSSSLEACELSWVCSRGIEDFPFRCSSKIRYRQQDQPCVIEKITEGIAYVSFPVPQRAVTPGQSIVFYSDEICLGGGIIL